MNLLTDWFTFLACPPKKVEEAVFPPPDVYSYNFWDLPILETLLILISTALICWAAFRLFSGNDQKEFKRLTGLAFLFSIAFIAVQVYFYKQTAFSFNPGKYDQAYFLSHGFFLFYFLVGVLIVFANFIIGHIKRLEDYYKYFACISAFYWTLLLIGWIYMNYRIFSCL